MKNLSKFFLGLLFLMLMVEVLIIAPQDLNFFSKQEVGLEEDPTQGAERANQKMQGLHLVETRGDQKEWELWANKAFGFEKKATWELKDVKAKFFAEGGVVFTVTGATGNVELESKNMKVKGQVVVRSSNGYRFKTDEVHYDSQARSLVGPGAAEMNGPKDDNGDRLNLSADGMIADLNESLMELVGTVRGGKILSDGRRLKLASNKAQFSAKSNFARFYETVAMDVGSMRVSGPESRFNYDSEGRQLKSVTITGGVRVSDRKKWATADEVIFYIKQDKFVFRGKPRVVQENDQLVGDEIVFLDGGKRVQVLRARAKVDKKTMEKVN